MDTKNIRLQTIRALITFSVLILTYTGYSKLPLGIAAAISTSEPIFVVLWSFLLGKESIESAKYLVPMVMLGFIGMCLIYGQNLVGMNMTLDQTLGLVSLLLANLICSGGHYLLVKLGKIDRSSTTVAYNILFNSAFMLVLIGITGASGTSFDISVIRPNLFTILLLGCSAWINSWIGLEIFKYIDPNTNSSIQNLILPMSMLISYFVEQERISGMQFIGISTIFASTLLLTYRKFNINKLDIRYDTKRKSLMRYITIAYLSLIGAIGLERVIYYTMRGNQDASQCCQHECKQPDHDHTLCS